MAAGNRKSSNKRKTQTKKERMAEMEKAQDISRGSNVVDCCCSCAAAFYQ